MSPIKMVNRYLQFGTNAAKTVTVNLEAFADITVNVRIDEYNGRIAAVLNVCEGKKMAEAALLCGVIGKHAIYFEFVSEIEGAIVEFDSFTFD